MAYLRKVVVEDVAGPFAGRVAGMAGDGGRLLFSLPKEDRILALNLATGDIEQVRRYTGKTTSVGFGADGRLYGCQPGARRVVCLEADGSMTLPAERLEGLVHNHPDCLTCGADGRIWFSDVRWEGRDSGLFPQLVYSSVLVLEKEGRGPWHLRRASCDPRIPGALQISADGATLYVASNPWQAGSKSEVRAYPVDADGRLGEPSSWLELATGRQGQETVTAMALAQGGALLLAVSAASGGEGALLVVDADGTRRAAAYVKFKPTSLGFAGRRLERLFMGSEDGRLREIHDLGLNGWSARPERPDADAGPRRR